MPPVLTLLLSHQSASDLEPVLELWRKLNPRSQVLLAYGGTRVNFDRIAFEPKVFVDDPRLRVRDQQRDKQSCSGVLKAACAWLRHRPEFDFVHYVEYDHVPLIHDLYTRLIDALEREDADVLAYKLQRIDGTSHPHYLYHAYDPEFHAYFSELSLRDEREVILSMLGTGAFWRREAFDAVAAHEEPFPIYTEVFVPTLAHHLGYRLRDFKGQNPFVSHVGNYGRHIERFRSQGAWTVHPVKRLPERWDGIVR